MIIDRSDSDLNQEFARYDERFGQIQKHILCSTYGVPRYAWREAPCQTLGWTGVVTFGDGTWQPWPNGADQMLVVATNVLPDGEIEDLIAFDPNNPWKWYHRTGLSRWLGEWELRRRGKTYPIDILATPGASESPTDAPLTVYADPLEWLRHSCDGVVALNDEALSDLRDGPPLCFTNLNQAQNVEAFLRKPMHNVPEIYWMGSE